MTIRVRNFDRFQHFKDRSPPWVKLYRDILDDLEWFELDPLAAKALVMLWLIASEDETKQGRLPDTKKLAFRLRISEKQLNDILFKLSHWLEHDDINVISTRYQLDAPETETETETKVETQGKPARKKTAPHSLPDDFEPNDACIDLAKSLGISWKAEIPRFRDHHSQKGTLGRDWQAGFRTWLNNSVKYGTATKATIGDSSEGSPSDIIKLPDGRVMTRAGLEMIRRFG